MGKGEGCSATSKSPVEIPTPLNQQIDRSSNSNLSPYWLACIACLAALTLYIALIIHLQTETARRGSAPPWYAWYRYPPTRTRLQALFLVAPAIAYAAWRGITHKLTSLKISPTAAVAVTILFTFLINATIAMMDGSPSAISKPFDRPGAEYFWDVKFVTSVHTFLHDYISNLPHYGIHTRTHPPGDVLILYLFSKLFAPGVTVASWCAVVFTATAVLPVYFLARKIAGQSTAYLVLALYPVVPSLVLFGATSMDGIILVFLAWTTYFLHRAISHPSLPNAILAGISLWLSAMMSYVVVCVLALMILYALLERSSLFPSFRAIFIATLITLAGFVLCYVLTGFDINHGFQASRYYDHYGMKTFKMTFPRYLDISFDNLIAFLVGLGPPTVILWLRQLRTDLSTPPKHNPHVSLNLALAVSIAFFSFAKLFTHETERVWLFFIPLVLIAAARAIQQATPKSPRLLEWTTSLLFAQCWLFQLLLYTIW
jgi:hypothetical protein